MAWFGLVLEHYFGFVSAEYVNFKYLPLDPVILENVPEICVAILA